MPPKVDNKRKFDATSNTSAEASTAQTSTTAATGSVTNQANYSISRYKETKFFTFAARRNPQDDDLTVDELIDLESAPAEKIEQAKRAKIIANTPKAKMLATDEKLAALSGKIDHHFDTTAKFGSIEVSVAGGTRQNKRDKNEDRYDVSKIAGMHHLSDTGVIWVMHEYVKQLQKRFGDAALVGGSTLLNVSIRVDSQTIVTTQLGDCQAWLMWKDADNNHNVRPLHTRLHNPGEPSEKKRIQDRGFKIVADAQVPSCKRLQSGLAVSRSLGDEAASKCGLIRVPEVSIFNYGDLIRQGASNLRVFLASDGMFIPKEYRTQVELAKTLASSAYQTTLILLTKQMLLRTENCADNGTLVMAQLPLEKLTVPEEAMTEETLSFTVCDGHVNEELPDLVAKFSGQVLQECVTDYIREYRPDVKVDFAVSGSLDSSSTVELSLPSQTDTCVQADDNQPGSKSPHSPSPSFWDIPATQPYYSRTPSPEPEEGRSPRQ